MAFVSLRQLENRGFQGPVNPESDFLWIFEKWLRENKSNRYSRDSPEVVIWDSRNHQENVGNGTGEVWRTDDLPKTDSELARFISENEAILDPSPRNSKLRKIDPREFPNA